MTDAAREKALRAIDALGDAVLSTDPDQVFHREFPDELQWHEFRSLWEHRRGEIVNGAAAPAPPKKPAKRSTVLTES